jgi:hypothetical protein
MQPPEVDKSQYEAWGVAPPSHEPHAHESVIEKYFAEKVRHGNWKQKGNYIECGSCPFRHGHAIDVSLILKGTDPEGLPILEKLDI